MRGFAMIRRRQVASRHCLGPRHTRPIFSTSVGRSQDSDSAQMEVPSEFPSFAPQGGDKRKLSSAEILARKLSFSAMGDDAVATSSSAQEKLRVVVRARPLQPSEVAADLTLADDAVAVRTVKSTAQGKDSVEEASFFFDRVYRGAASQSDVFDGSMLPQVQALFAGRDTLTFAYGITNAGKTYTIQGKGGADEMGCIPRALEATFCALRHHAAKRAAAADGSVASPEPLTGAAASLELDDKCTYEVKASFLEVYGNDAFDLLATPEPPAAAGPRPSKRAVLRLKEDRGHVFVEGLEGGRAARPRVGRPRGQPRLGAARVRFQRPQRRVLALARGAVRQAAHPQAGQRQAVGHPLMHRRSGGRRAPEEDGNDDADEWHAP